MQLSQVSRFFFAIVIFCALTEAKTIRVPSTGINTLQDAVNAAAAGDTIVITIDTPGAIVDRQLTIQGTGGAAVSAAVATFEGSTFGIGLTCTGPSSPSTCASGSLIRNVTIDGTSTGPRPDLGIVTGGAVLHGGFGSAAKDVTVRQCNIVETFQGISGRCARDDASAGACPTGWTVAQNDISLNSGATSKTGAYIGIVAYNGADNWSITHNEVTRPNNPAPQISDCFSGIAGIQVLASSDPFYTGSPATITAVAVKQNKVAVKGQCINLSTTCAGTQTSNSSCAEPVVVAADSGAPPASNDLTTVAYNDLRDSNNQVLVFAFADPSTPPPGASCSGSASNDLTGLHQYSWPFIFGTGSVTCLTSLGNMDDFGNGNRGSTSNSVVRPGKILPK